MTEHGSEVLNRTQHNSARPVNPIRACKIFGVCKAIEQRTTALPNDEKTINIAERDNQLIDANTLSIGCLQASITNNLENSAYSPEMINNTNWELRQRITEKIRQIIQIKNTEINADDIAKRTNEA